MSGLSIQSGEWVVVCDGAKALVLENVGDNKFPNLKTVDVFEQEDKPTREMGTDAPGRSHSSVGHGRSAMEQTDWHDQAEERFAAAVADTLYQMEHAQEFSELVMVAPPKMLGDLRAKLHQEVADCVVAEVAKDLTAHPIPEIGRLLS